MSDIDSIYEELWQQYNSARATLVEMCATIFKLEHWHTSSLDDRKYILTFIESYKVKGIVQLNKDVKRVEECLINLLETLEEAEETNEKN